MVSKNQIKLITSLQQKKYRTNHQLFCAEGVKVIQELLSSNLELEHIYHTESVFDTIVPEKKTLITAGDLRKMSSLTNQNNCLALFKIPISKPIIEEGLLLALDDVRDPGNFGTIIRLADWFGIKQIICSEQTVDVYNPKVVQATMGSLSRVSINYVDLHEYISKTTLPVYGTFMEGNTIYQEPLTEAGIVVMGNEGNGINPILEKIIKNRLTIPRFGDFNQTESLNVATATAIILSEFRRRNNGVY